MFNSNLSVLSDCCRFDTILKSQRRTVNYHKTKKVRNTSNFPCLQFAVKKWTVRRGLYKLVEALTLPTTHFSVLNLSTNPAETGNSVLKCEHII